MDEKQKKQTELEKIRNALKTEHDYRYETLLGRGSFGQVVQAEHPYDGQKYAIKILPIAHGERAKYQEREVNLLVECDLWKRNIVKYYGCWPMRIENEPFLCIQMELCRVSLEAFVYSNDMGGAKIIQVRSQPRLYQQVFPQILNGLDAMHSIGWVHRDIHISNILIAYPKPSKINDIVIKIADFGLARKIGPIINASTSPTLTDAPKLEKLSFDIGSELFRAPELSTCEYDYKVDLFSAGIVLYFLSHYLEDKTLWKTEFSELRSGKRGKKDLYHQDDEKLFHLFSQLLRKDPEARPSAAKALNVHLETMEHQKPTETTDSGPGKPKMDTFLFKKDGYELDSKQSAKLTEAKSEAKKFLFKKDGDALTRCIINDDSLSSLKAGIQDGSGIEAGSQVLHQKTTIEGEEELIKIMTDMDVRCMFQSAEEEKKKVVILVTEVDNVSEMDEVNPEA